LCANFRAPDVRLARAGGNDHTLVRDVTTPANRIEVTWRAFEIEIDDFAKKNPRVPLAAANVADRRRDVPLGENPGRKLIEQRLKQVVVRPVDDRDIDIGAPQRFRRKESAESAADDRDGMPAGPLPKRSSHYLRA
jgi:hypothetical protein